MRIAAGSTFRNYAGRQPSMAIANCIHVHAFGTPVAPNHFTLLHIVCVKTMELAVVRAIRANDGISLIAPSLQTKHTYAISQRLAFVRFTDDENI